MLYQFGPNELDSAIFELRRSHWRVRLSAQPMELLLLLASRRGALVTREEIASLLWPGLALGDLDSRINTAIAQIRAALNDDAARPRYLETVIGKGYRFVCAVKIIESAELTATAASISSNSVALDVEAPGVLERPASLAQLPLVEPAGHARPVADMPFLPRVAEGTIGSPDGNHPHSLGSISPLKLTTFLLMSMLILVAAAGGLWAFRSHHPVPQRRHEWKLEAITNNDSDHPVGAAAISPDGQWLAYTEPTGVFLREMRTGRTRPLQAPAMSALRLVWFKDGKQLLLTGFEHNDVGPDIWILFADGGQARLFRREAADGAPSPDGRSVAFTVDSGQAIHLVGVDGSGERTIVHGNADRVFSALFWPASGQRISFQQRTPSGSPAAEIEMNYEWTYSSVDLHSLLETASAKDLPFDSAEETSVGRIFFLRSHPVKDVAHNGLWSVATDPATGALKGVPERLASLDEQQTSGLSLNAASTQVAVVRQHLQPDIYVAELVKPGLGLGKAKRLTSTLSSDYPYSWSKDDDAIYFESNRVNLKWHVFEQRADSSNAVMLTFGDNQQFFPTLMPGGKTLVYEQWAFINGQKERSIYRANSDGTGGKLVWKESALDEWRCPLLSGSTCTLRETEGQRMFVFYALDLTTGKGKELARSAWEPTFLGDWALSSDGASAALPDHDPHLPSIRLVPLDGSGTEKTITLKEGVLLSGIHWSTNAQGFYVEAQIGTHNQLQFINLEGAVRVLRDATGNIWGLPSKDGKKLAIADSTISRNVWLWQ